MGAILIILFGVERCFARIQPTACCPSLASELNEKQIAERLVVSPFTGRT